MNRKEGIAYLLRDGNHDVPCSRYGRNTAECAPLAWRAAVVIADAGGEPVNRAILDECMAFVVNGHPEVQMLLERETG